MSLPEVRPSVLILETSEGRLHRSLGHRFFERFPTRARALQPMDLGGIPESLPVLRCAATRTAEGPPAVRDQDVEAIRRHDLDLILWFVPGVPENDLAGAARYGVWIFRHGDSDPTGTIPPGYREVAEGRRVTRATLERALPGGDRVLLREGHFRTFGHHCAKQIDNLLFASARWPAQACIDIRNGRPAGIDAPPSTTPHRSPRSASLATFALLLRIAGNGAREIGRRLFLHDRWRLGVVRAPTGHFLRPDRPVPEVEWIGSGSPSRFLADPFGIFRDGRLTILCEEFDYRSGMGRIVRIAESSGVAPSPVAIGPPIHLSYPFLFEDGGNVYCVPESLDAGEVGLYRADRFPEAWSLVATPVRGLPVVDPTIFRHDGIWWLAGGIAGEGRNRDLYLWYAAKLTGPWNPHANNPVKTDIRAARPAGTPFEVEGTLYRPAQDCSEDYGGRVVIHRIVRLDPSTFEEEPVSVVEPRHVGGFPDGIHTLSTAGDITLIDNKRRGFILPAVTGLMHDLVRTPKKRPRDGRSEME